MSAVADAARAALLAHRADQEARRTQRMLTLQRDAQAAITTVLGMTWTAARLQVRLTDLDRRLVVAGDEVVNLLAQESAAGSWSVHVARLDAGQWVPGRQVETLLDVARALDGQV